MTRLRGHDMTRLLDARAKIYFVMPCLDHDLAGMMENPRMQFTPGVVKCLLQQMLEGIPYAGSFAFYLCQ